MSGFWYITVIAAATGTLVSVATNTPAKRLAPLAFSAPSLEIFAQANNTKNGLIESNQQTDKETNAEETYAEAIALANQAVIAYQSAQKEQNLDRSIRFTQQERDLWQTTLQKLESIPATADSYTQAQVKRAQYQRLLATAQNKITKANSAFLADIISNANISPDQAHISLCEIGSDLEAADSCQHHQGNQHMASPASLIKLPIAIALMDKLTREEIPLSQKIYIDPQNFTENAEGIGIEVEKEYTLAQVMSRMLGESNNIATNQLIDYIGREAIAKTLAQRGYRNTLVDHKLAGDRILPPNPGTHKNQATANDITRMMAEIYELAYPGDEALLIALYGQRDQELGYQALQNLNTNIEWLGEKTGQNDRMIGSTLALRVGPKRYALTVALDYSGDPAAIRDIIRGIATHLLEKE